MRPIGVVSAMSYRDIGGGGGPPPRDSNLQPSPNSQSVQSARRKLFGDVDHDQTRRDLERELRECEDRDKNKYNFDFAKETPINSVASRYKWSSVGHDLNDTDVKKCSQQQFSTKLRKPSDGLVIANQSQSLSASPSSETSSTTMSSNMVQKSSPTSATIITDSQSIASSSDVQFIAIAGHDVNQSGSQVKTTKQSEITGN